MVKRMVLDLTEDEAKLLTAGFASALAAAKGDEHAVHTAAQLTLMHMHAVITLNAKLHGLVETFITSAEEPG